MFFYRNENKVVEQLFTDVCNNFTYEFWVKPLAMHRFIGEDSDGVTGIFGQKYLIGPGHGQTDERAGVGVSVGINGVSVFEHTNNYLPALLVYPEIINEWTHIAIVYNDKTPYLYINGEFKRAGLRSKKNNVYASGLFGGYDPYGYYYGYVKDIKIWNYAKSNDEIKRGMHQVLTGEEDGLFGYWWFHNNITVSPPNFFYDICTTTVPDR